MATNLTSTDIRREAPFLEDYRRRLLDGLYGGTKIDPKTGKKIDPGILDTPQQQFQRGIAGFAPQESAAFNLASSQMGIDPKTGKQTGLAGYQPFISGAQQQLGTAQATTALGIPSLQAAQQQYDPTTANTQDFMNQYQSNVTQEALQQLDQEAQKAQSDLAAKANQAGAFGGSRFGVQSAELSKNLQDIKSRRIFEDLSKNFMQAQQSAIGTSEANRARNLQSAQTYGSLGQGQAGQAQAFGNLGAQQAQLGQQGIQSLLGVGQIGRTRDQAVQDELFRYSSANAMEPRQRIQFGSDILAQTPSIQQSISQQPIPYTNPLAAGVGAGIAGASALSNFYGNN